MNDKDKNCGTCCWRCLENQITKIHDPLKVVWFCDNSESDNYMEDVSDPHRSCDAWEG